MHPRAHTASGTPSRRESSLSATLEGASPLTFGGASPIGEDSRVTAGSPDQDVEWWTTSDVAAYLDVRVATVSNYRKHGRMPEPDQTVGRTHMWRPRRIVEWHESRTRVGVGGRPRADTPVNGEARIVEDSPNGQEEEIPDSGPTLEIDPTPESGQ